jgi:hypothetical protein
MHDIKPGQNQDPQKAVDAKFGTYKDPVETLSDADRLPNLKEGPSPSPFKQLRDA